MADGGDAEAAAVVPLGTVSDVAIMEIVGASAPSGSPSVSARIISSSSAARRREEIEARFLEIAAAIRETDLNDDESSSSGGSASSHNIEELPVEVLKHIFHPLELKHRGQAAQVCRLWNSALTNGSCPYEDVVVFNIFEKSIWDTNVSRNAGRVNAIHISEVSALHNIIQHCRSVCSVKIWYGAKKFAEMVIDALAQTDMRMKYVDIYPYSPEVVVDYLHEKLPETPGLTMRPHSQDFFWTGLELSSFPAFKHLQTLILDSFNIGENMTLPDSITTLEFMNRNNRKFDPLIRVLPKLFRLEYLSLSHADFGGNETFSAFINAIRPSNLPRLSILIFRFCKLNGFSPSLPDDAYLPDGGVLRLRMLKIDLCYGPLSCIISTFLEITTKALDFLSLNVISERETLSDVYSSVAELKRRNIYLYLGILQKDQNDTCKVHEGLTPPLAFYQVLSKFEASFVNDAGMLRTMLTGSNFVMGHEFKFIQCPGLTDDVLQHLSKEAPHLKRLNVINCENATEPGMISFVENFHLRVAPVLNIVWKRHRRFTRPASFYLSIVNEHRELISRKKSRFYSKTFSEDADGEEIIVWERDTKKMLTLRDFSEQDTYRIVGVVIPYSATNESPQTCTIPPLAPQF